MNFSDKNSTDQELDNLFRRAHANELPPPPFKDSFFEEIEGLLPSAEKKRRGIIFWWIIPAAAILVGLYFGFDFGNRVSFNFESPKFDYYTQSEINESVNKTTISSNNLVSSSISERNTENASKKIKESRLESPFRLNPFNNSSKDQAICKGLSFGGDNYTSSTSKVKVDQLTAKSLLTLEMANDSIPLLPIEKVFHTDYYVQFGLLIGQSPRKDVSGNSNLLSGFSAGIGLKRSVKNMGIEFGLNYRFEHVNNAIWNDQISIADPNSGVVNTYQRQIDISNIHSIEFPLVFSFETPRNSFGLSVNPGIQLLFNGDEYIYVDQEKVRTKKSFNPSETSSTLTLEMGLQHAVNLNEHFSIVSSLRADILRPFNQSNFSGANTLLPLNAQLALRYRF